MFTILEHRIKEDLKKAKMEGFKETITELLEEKFGGIDEEMQKLLDSSSIEKLKKLSRAILHIDTAEEAKKILEDI